MRRDATRCAVHLSGKFLFIIFNAPLFTVLIYGKTKKASDADDGNSDVRLAYSESGKKQIHTGRARCFQAK